MHKSILRMIISCVTIRSSDQTYGHYVLVFLNVSTFCSEILSFEFRLVFRFNLALHHFDTVDNQLLLDSPQAIRSQPSGRSDCKMHYFPSESLGPFTQCD